MELILATKEDLQKLAGWQIKEAVLTTDGVDPSLVLQLTHVLAECPVKMTIRPSVAFVNSGRKFTVNTELKLSTTDVR